MDKNTVIDALKALFETSLEVKIRDVLGALKLEITSSNLRSIQRLLAQLVNEKNLYPKEMQEEGHMFSRRNKFCQIGPS